MPCAPVLLALCSLCSETCSGSSGLAQVPPPCRHAGGETSRQSALPCAPQHPGQEFPVPVRARYEPALVSVRYTTSAAPESPETPLRRRLPQISSPYRALRLPSSPCGVAQPVRSLPPLEALPEALGKIQSCSPKLPAARRALRLPMASPVRAVLPCLGKAEESPLLCARTSHVRFCCNHL